LCYSPGRYTKAEIEKDQLVFRELDGTPGSIEGISIEKVAGK
jgi:hypothetical protein